MDGYAHAGRPGWWKKAEYREPVHDSEVGNPLMLALPPPRSFETWAADLDVAIPDVERDRASLLPEIRSECCLLVPRFVRPTAQNIAIATSLCSCIRASYHGRNPSGPSWFDRTHARSLDRTGTKQGSPLAACSGVGGTVTGPSGVGKSFALDAAQREFPQVVEHSSFGGKPLSLLQLVWFRSQVSFGGSPGALGLTAIRAVDTLLQTNFRDIHSGRMRNADGALDAIRSVCEQQFLGTWIVDDVQNLKLADRKSRQKAVTFFQAILDETGMSLLLAGTGESSDVMAEAMHGSRRVVGVGSISFPRFTPGKAWDSFTRALFAYQYVREPAAWSPQWAAVLFSLVLGVTDLAVKLFVMTQRRALLEGGETISEALMRQEFRTSFGPVFRSLAVIAGNLESGKADPMSEPDEHGFRESLALIQPSSVPPPDRKTSGGGERRAAKAMTVPGTPSGTVAELRGALALLQEPTVAGVVADGAAAGKTARQALDEAGMGV